MGRDSGVILLPDDGVISLFSPSETFLFGKMVASFVRPGSILALSGDLGAGPTSCVQGFGDGLGVRESIRSPTFHYLDIHEEGEIPLYHFDLYRLTSSEDFFSMGFDEYFEKGGVVAVEWPERLENKLPPEALSFQFSYIDGGRQVRVPSFVLKGEKLWG